MRVKNNILILDTETVGDFGQPFVHDIGYCIIDKDFNVLKATRHLVKQARECNWALNYSQFYKTKAPLYDKAIESGDVDIKSWKEIMEEFVGDLRKYKVGCISAYNLAFDYRALNFTNQFLANGDLTFEKLLDKKKWLCIWNLACETILDSGDYKDWCKENNCISEAGNYMTNAECSYRYITGRLGFNEEHTALADVLIEKDILKYIVENSKGRPQYGLQYGCWKKIQDKATE